MNPAGTVPIIFDNENANLIIDSSVICEYIEEKDLDGLLKAKRSNNILQPQRVYGVRDIKECIREALINIKKNNELLEKVNNLHC